MTGWLRLWHDMPTDPKWRVIARRSGQRIGDVISVYTMMMVCASESDDRGSLDRWSSEDAAAALDLDEADVVAIVEAMEAKVTENGRLSGWEKRQPKREDGAAERAKAWRERKNEHRERNRTHQNAPERPEQSRTYTEQIAAAADAPARAREPMIADGFQREEHVDIACGIIEKIHERWPEWMPPADKSLVKQWLADGINRQTIVDAIEAKIPRMNSPPGSFKYFYGCVSELHRSLSQPTASTEFRNDQRYDRQPRIDNLTAAFAERAAARARRPATGGVAPGDDFP